MGALDGVKVLELAGIGPGPFCGMMLADMGADVVRIDRAGSVKEFDENSPPNDIISRGRKSIGIDLKNPNFIPDAVKILLLGPGVTYITKLYALIARSNSQVIIKKTNL